jgi:hypothetical protein
VGVASPALKQSIFMQMKPSQFSLGRHPLSDAPYWNPNMVIREQGSGRHRLSGAPYWNPDMVTSDILEPEYGDKRTRVRSSPP